MIFTNTNYAPQIGYRLEHIAVLVITLSTLLGPSYLLSIAMTHFWPLYLMIGTLILGTIFGAMKFLYASDEVLSRDALAYALKCCSQSVADQIRGVPKHLIE
jgi:hypothetical protein